MDQITERGHGMHLLFALALIPIIVAIVMARGEPAKTISCLGLMSVGVVIGCLMLLGLVRQKRGDQAGA